MAKQQEEEKRRLAKDALEAKRREEERELWWAGAELFRKTSAVEVEEVSWPSTESSLMMRYTNDYSRWEEWEPSDPVSILENQKLQEEKEKRDNEEFERSNPEFCQQFISDMEERNKALAKKQENADSLRIKGNQAFKRKDFSLALTLYKDSLKLQPYSEKTLLNIAQCLIKLTLYEDALEMLKRVLFLNDQNAKVRTSSTENSLEFIVYLRPGIGMPSF